MVMSVDMTAARPAGCVPSRTNRAAKATDIANAAVVSGRRPRTGPSGAPARWTLIATAAQHKATAAAISTAHVQHRVERGVAHDESVTSAASSIAKPAQVAPLRPAQVMKTDRSWCPRAAAYTDGAAAIAITAPNGVRAIVRSSGPVMTSGTMVTMTMPCHT